MLSERDYILFLETLFRKNSSINFLSGLRIYRRWLWQQGFNDWDDWEDLVDIVIGKSSRWNLQYLPEGDWENHNIPFDMDWQVSGYWGNWDSTIHYLDVWIDSNEPLEDFDEETAKLSYENLSFPDRNLKDNNFSKTQSLLEEELDFMTEEVKSQIKQIDDRTANILQYIEQQVSELTDKNKQSKDFDQKYLSLELELERTKAQLEIVISDRDSLNHGNTQLVSQVATITAERYCFEQQNSELRARLSTLESENKHLDSQNSHLQGSLNEAHQQNASFGSCLDKIQALLSDEKQKNENLLTQINKLDQEKENISNQLSDKEEELKRCSKEQEIKLQNNVELKEDFSKSENKLQTLQKEYDELHSDLEGADALVEQLKEDKIRFESKLAEKEEQLKQLESESGYLRGLVDAASSERQNLQAQNDRLQTEIQKLLKEKSASTEKLLERSQLLEEANHQLTILSQDLSPAIQLVIERLDQFQPDTTLPEALNVFHQLATQIHQVNGQLQAIRPVAAPLINGLRQENAELQKRVQQTETERDRFKASVEHRNEQILQLRSDINLLNSDKSESERQRTYTQSQLDQSEARNFTLQEQLKEVKVTLKQAHEDLEKSERKAAKLKSQLEDAESQLQVIQGQLQSTQEHAKELEEQQKCLEGQLGETQQKFEQAQSDLTNLRKSMENLRSRFTGAQLLKKQFKQQLCECSESRQRLSEQFETTVSELAQTQASLQATQEGIQGKVNQIFNLERQIRRRFIG